MISGSYTLGKTPFFYPYQSGLGKYGEDLVFTPVTFANFYGGYFLNTHLPYTHQDFYYYDESNDLMVLLSGSIYNKDRISYHIPGLADTAPDPEFIASLFLKNGPEFVSNLNGDFAIFILRQARSEAFLYRDHVGIRPVAYTTNENAISFSTDITEICRSLAQGEMIDSEYLTRYFRYIDLRVTPYKEVRKLLPGHYLHFSGDGVNIRKYWEPERIRTDRRLTYGMMLSDLSDLLHDAVSIRCDNRFNAGAHVSSGIDSGIVAVLARKEYKDQKSFYGFSWTPADYDRSDVTYDERKLVRKLCYTNGVTPLFSDLNSDNFPDIISGFFLNDGFFSEARTLRQAADAGVNLLFSGWGGDEFISTAAPAIETDLLRNLKLSLYLRRNEISKPKRFFRNLVRYVIRPVLCIHDRSTARAFRNDSRYLKKPFRKSDRRAVTQFYFHSSRRGHHLGMLDFYHLQDRCEKWFVMGYIKGVEYRYPLLDKRIIEFMLGMPSELLCKSGFSRPLLRELGVGILPDEIRLNMSKNDPVYWKFIDGLFENAAISLMGEINDWKGNPDLNFIDFELLNLDIQNYKRNRSEVEDKVLYRALIYIKALHEFSKDFHDCRAS